jgi:hypothetical protein
LSTESGAERERASHEYTDGYEAVHGNRLSLISPHRVAMFHENALAENADGQAPAAELCRKLEQVCRTDFVNVYEFSQMQIFWRRGAGSNRR